MSELYKTVYWTSVVVRDAIVSDKKNLTGILMKLCKNMYICGKYTHLGILLILIKERMIIMKQVKQPSCCVGKHTPYKAINLSVIYTKHPS